MEDIGFSDRICCKEFNRDEKLECILNNEEYILGHTCPYKSELYQNDELCDCCDDCQYECAQGI